MEQLNTKLVLDLIPRKGNPRNSEGAFIRQDDGTILFAYSRYSGDNWYDHQPSDIALIRSTDEGETWSEPEIIAAAGEFGAANVMSVSAIRQADGKIGFYFMAKLFDEGKEGSLEGIYSVLCRAITADGFHFQKERCGFYAPKGYYVFNNDRLVRLSDGRLVYPAGYMDTLRHFVSTVFVSEDDGASFVRHETMLDLPFANDRGMEEPGILEHKDGRLRLWMRTNIGYQYESYSYDNLKSFSAPVPSAFTSPRSPMEIEYGPDGALYAIYNPIPTYNGRITTRASHGGRNPLVIRKSADDGKTWGSCYIIEADEDRGFCYPSMYFTNDGCLLVSYCRGGTEDGFCLTRLGIRKFSLKDMEQ